LHRAILGHYHDEEKEHAAMRLEWLQRSNRDRAKELKDYLFTDKPIAHAPVAASRACGKEWLPGPDSNQRPTG